MRGLFSNYAFSLKLASYVAIASLVGASLASLRARWAGRRATKPAAQVLAIGSGVVIAIATALPQDWPPLWGRGDLALDIGSGGLSDWRVLVEDPNSLAAVLLVANVLLYVPLAFFWITGWSGRTALVLLGCLLLSVSVELAQLAVLEGVASIDDVLLNAAGAIAGAILAAAVRAGRRGAADSIGS